MSLSTTEELRIRAIENKLNEIQTALNNVAGKSQLKNTLGIIQRQINDLQDLVGQVEAESSAAALTVHKTNSAAHSEIDSRFFKRTEFVTTSNGITDAGKPLKLNSSGEIDASLVSLSLESHSTLSGLDVDDHTQYLTTTRHSAISGNPHSITIADIGAVSSNELDTVSGILQSQINTKSDDGHTHDDRYYTETEIDVLFTDVNNDITTTSGLLQTTIDSKADSIHSHNDLYYTESEVNTLSGVLQSQINNKSDTGHNHNSSYYTESEIDALLSLLESADNTISGILQTQIDNKSDISHSHNNLYYTESEIDVFVSDLESTITTTSGLLQIAIDGKSDIGHLHNDYYYTELEIDTLSGILQSQIDFKSDSSHIHDSRYYTTTEINNFDFTNNTRVDTVSGELQTQINTKSDNTHLHDDRYYTEVEVNAFDFSTNTIVNTVSGTLQTQINNKSDTNHLHHDTYYTESEIDARFVASGINISGTPINNQLAVWTDVNTIEGDANLTWDGSVLSSYALTTTANILAGGSIRAGSSNYIFFTSRSALSSSINGNLMVSNNNATDFGLLQLGGTTNAYPAIKRNGTKLDFRLANDSDFASAEGSSFIVNFQVRWPNSTRLDASGSDGNLRLTNNAQNDFGLLRFGGTTSSYPAIKRNNADLELVTADDSGFTGLTVSDVKFGGDTASYPMLYNVGAGLHLKKADNSDYANLFINTLTLYGDFIAGDVQVGGANYLKFGSGRTKLSAPIDGNLLTTNAAGNDFGLLQFGGTTSSYPALKRNGTELHCRLADDSDYVDLTANTVSGVRGILPPAVDNTGMSAITSPEQGLMIYNTTSGVISVYDGSVWRSLAWA